MIPPALQSGLALAGLAVGAILGIIVVWKITKSLIKLLLWCAVLAVLVFGLLMLLAPAV